MPQTFGRRKVQPYVCFFFYQDTGESSEATAAVFFLNTYGSFFEVTDLGYSFVYFNSTRII